uniref:N-acetylglucosaminyl-phosphatidylinositol de-N-acetylase isoform X2 n=1 Tax=Monopterus albus TaxID=43700 RepID=UPI0009B30698|nr:N-acetylglucosaminyl-phosphatidylinositol de-N-acetylase isoform X2 [Monopterus albus]
MVTVRIMSIYLILFIILSYLVWIRCIYCQHRRAFFKSLKHVMNVLSSRDTNCSEISALIVTAHPDDECMFFAPTIIRLVELNVSVHLLCLTEGNYYKQGAQRKQELLKSCAMLGIPSSSITIVDHNKLPDDPTAEWSIPLVSSVIVKHIRAHSFNLVLTFDGKGVSGHANHRAIHKAVSHLASTGQVPNDCSLLSLVTVGLFRKYISFLELPISWLLPSCLCCIVGSRGYRQAKVRQFVKRLPCFVIALNSCGFVTCTSPSHATCS